MRVQILFSPSTDQKTRKRLKQIESMARGAGSAVAVYPSSKGRISTFVSCTKEVGTSDRKKYDKEILRLVDQGKVVILYHLGGFRSDFGESFEQEFIGVLGRNFHGQFGQEINFGFRFRFLEIDRGIFDAVF